MANLDLTPTQAATLESLVDSCGLGAVLEALSAICGEKAEHIDQAYGDGALARHWRTAEGAVGVVATAPDVLTVSR